MKKSNATKILATVILLLVLAAGIYIAWVVIPNGNKEEPEKISIATISPSGISEPPMPAPSQGAAPAPTSTTSVATAESTPTSTFTMTPIPMPDSALLDVPSYNQSDLGYPTGCEIVSLAMLLNYSVKDADAQGFVDALVAEMPRDNDPRIGYRGDPASKSGWTILPSALLTLTNESLGVESAEDMTGLNISDLKEKLNEDKPVEVWVDGSDWGFGIHALCLTGYDENGFYYNDPWTGEKDAFINYDKFYSIWNTTIYDRVLKISFGPRIALSY